jgi:general secretion pathway protein C
MLMTKARVSWSPKIITFALSALAAASAAYWGLKEWHTPASVDVFAAPVKPTPVTTSMVARALGGGQVNLAAMPTTTLASARYAVVGIVANRSGGGVALISVDGKAPRPVRVGARINDRLMLQSVDGRRALLAGGLDKPVEVTLELPKLAK